MLLLFVVVVFGFTQASLVVGALRLKFFEHDGDSLKGFQIGRQSVAAEFVTPYLQPCIPFFRHGNDRPKICGWFGFDGNDYVFALEPGGESDVGEAAGKLFGT
jgi:hypothetical protein